MKIQIKDRFTGSVIFETDAETIGAAVAAAIVAKANLSYADLSSADLRSANLRSADLSSADLSSANLSYANLRSANLSYAHLSSANLSYADLSYADLSSANLSYANLRSANLSYADLREIKCPKRELAQLVSARTILPEGELLVWKQLQEGIICQLKIPADAKRVGGLTGRKCRAEFAVVVSGNGKSIHGGMEYKEGETVRPDKFDPNPLVECSNGIHFFITKQEAERYE